MNIRESFNKKIWQLAEFDERKSLMISQNFNINNFLSKLIAIKNIDIGDINFYLEPDINKILPDPFILKDMEKSVIRIFKSILNKERIGIISDYDVDGSSSAALLIKFFDYIDVEYTLEIPDRINEGYGPNLRIIDSFKKNNIDLILCLDCGTTSFDTFNKSTLNNIDVIVIDHHIGEIKFPYVYGLINPNRIDEKNDLKNLAAVGVVFLMLIALRRELRKNDYYKLNNYKEHNLTSYLDLVALGTICDVVSLKKLNRAYVYKGLKVLYKRENLGLSSLIDNSNIRRVPNVFDLSFIIGPRLNAASRIGNPNLASKVLSSNNILEIESISRKLQLLNEKRKLIENKIINEARDQAYKQLKKKVIIVNSFNWHPGVIGIVASRILDEFQKPVIVISKNESEGVGSARSTNNIDLGSIIIAAKEEGLLIKGGGHKFAAGLKIKNSKIDQFSNFIEKIIESHFNESFENIIIFDSVLSLEEINENLIENLEVLEPYGNGNTEPKFIIENLVIDFIKVIKDKHIMIVFRNNLGNTIKAISFNSIDTPLGDNLLNSKNKSLNVLVNIKRDNFKNENIAQLIVIDAINYQ